MNRAFWLSGATWRQCRRWTYLHWLERVPLDADRAFCACVLHFVKPDGSTVLGVCTLPIPGAGGLPDTIGASFAATGRGWRHPTSTCKRPASWKEGRWPEIQGARCVGLRRTSAMAPDPGAQGADR